MSVRPKTTRAKAKTRAVSRPTSTPSMAGKGLGPPPKPSAAMTASMKAGIAGKGKTTLPPASLVSNKITTMPVGKTPRR